MLTPGTPVFIEWVDSKALSGWIRDGNYDVGYIRTIGWVVKDERDNITVSASRSSDGFCYDPFTVPRGCITEIEESPLA